MLVSTFTIFLLPFAINVQSCSWWIEIVPSMEQFTWQVVCEHLADFQRHFWILKANIHNTGSSCHVLCNARFYCGDFFSTFCYKHSKLLVMDWNCSIDRTVYRASGTSKTIVISQDSYGEETISAVQVYPYLLVWKWEAILSILPP